ncbi:SusD/RagB family nutrient-binding outer membrane lipoprotein [Chryseobacterium wanjuense]
MKNIKNNIKIIVGLLISGVFAISCNEYLDVNENPNSIHEEQLTPELVFPGSRSQIYRTQANTMMQFGNVMMNSWAGNSYTFGSPFPKEYTLSSVDNSFYNGIWNGIYLSAANFDYIENVNNADHKNDNYVAMAKILKSFYMQTIVDLYGDVPYSQAFKGQANLTPKYDNDETIYKALIENLDAAIAIIDAQDPNALEASSDIIFHSDMTKWKAFANTVKLRMLLRMSKVTGEMATYRDQKLATLASATFINEDVLENPGYAPDNDDKMNPFFLTWRVNSAGSAPQNYNFITASEHIAIALNGNPNSFTESYYQKFNGIVDPRRSRLFTLVTYSGFLLDRVLKV